MTLKSQMQSDVADVFLNTSEHAETATYYAEGKPGVSVTVICNRDYDTGITALPHIQEEESRASIWCSTQDISNPVRGDAIVIGSEEWRVEGRTSRDGFYGQWLACILSRIETAGNPYGDRGLPQRGR